MNRKKIIDLTEKTVFLEINVIAFCGDLSEKLGNSSFPEQLMHYASAIGGNYRDAHRTRSRVEYKRKLTNIIEDIEDLIYFLQLMKEIDEGDNIMVEMLIKEASQILLGIKESLDSKRPIKTNHKTYVR